MTNGTETLLSEHDYLIMSVYLILLGITAFAANSFVIYVLLRGELSYHHIHNKLLLNIAVADLMLSCIAFPLFASSSVARRWLFSDLGCTFAGFCIFCLAQNDMNSHAAIAICRYIIVCKPQYEYYLKRNKFVALIFVAVWGHTIFFTSLPLFGWSRYTQEAFGTSCTIDWIDTSPPILAYNIIIVITCYCMHVVIFIFCYYCVIKEFTVASQCIVRMRDEVIVDAETQKLEVILKCHKTMTYRKVTMASIGMVCAFMIAWTPYAILSVYVMFNPRAPAWALVAPTMFAKSSTVLSPLSCALLSGCFRKAVKKIFCRRRIRESLSPYETMTLSDRQHLASLSREGYVQLHKGELTINDIYIGNVEINYPTYEMTMARMSTQGQ